MTVHFYNLILLIIHLYLDKIPKLNPIVGDIVIALSPEYQVFYRGKILRNNNNESYIVYYIDYGNKETIPSDAIFELADELKKVFILVFM